ncbi:putative transmembrane protein 94 [Skeletonema marinoi]|uniref:Transmembrane protein 94 n=1 Tax=Skeletonema marinoi TaxID=267567 RepID=A0AAD9DB97_9STRA|nr:putative transmembrane protein 94 [Skeletonema marinoi]
MTKSQSDDSDDDDDEKVKLDSDTNNHDVNTKSMLDNVGAIPRKNVEDVHSTYRISCSDIDGKEGDFIALKVGDTAPAKCRPLSSSSSSDDGIIEAGERLTIQSLPKMTKETLVFHDTPTPKAAKNSNQKVVVDCCHKGDIVSNITPEQTAKHRPPAVLRQGKAIRIAFFIIGLTLSVLPITSPVYLYLLESIGTSRILATAHPLASNQKWNRELMDRGGTLIKPSARLLFRYITATCSSRIVTTLPIRKGLSSKKVESSSDTLLNIPPASLYLLEKLGVVTALTLIDDELACDPFSTPQQLLIPSGQGGLKLLDLCPVYEEEEDADASEGTEHNGNTTTRDVSSDSDDSNDETRFNFNHSFYAPRKTLRSIRKYKKKKFAGGKVREEKGEEDEEREESKISSEVQFEDPQWWKFLPSLKCIGLVASAFGEGLLTAEKRKKKMAPNSSDGSISKPKTSLIDHLCCVERERNQLRLLSQCIGFDTAPNESGSRGDLSCFVERLRLHIISSNLLRERMQLDSHAMGLEEFRNWSLLYTDADVVFVKDKRLESGNQAMPDCFQGENSTISPLTAGDRKVINNTQKEWMLSDLDVQAFSYAPLPYTADQKIGSAKGKGIYLLDNAPASNPHIPSHDYWGLVKHQIFLGLLGSSVGPRKEIEPFIHSCNDAGVRFVYFSPRNMRRTKELASQMGLDVAWNCCISLRPLEEGADDNFRMTSNYADWDVNAKLPHGVEDVKRHLEEVDNVPLLVSLYTDVSKKTTAEMVDVFQDYNDTVLAVGLSHLPGNQKVFFGSDIAIGVDVLSEEVSFAEVGKGCDTLMPSEVAFVSSISTWSSSINLVGSQAMYHILEIIRIGRSSLEAAVTSVGFFFTGFATSVPIIPPLGSFLYNQVILPMIGLSLAFTDGSNEFMSRVPSKNESFRYSWRGSRRIYFNGLLRAFLPAVVPHFLYLIALGELMWKFDPQFVAENAFCHQTTVNSGSEAVVTSHQMRST